MKQKIDFLPSKLTKEEIASAPLDWIGILSNYQKYRKKAIREDMSGYNTLIAILSVAIVKHDKDLINTAIEFTKENIPSHIYMSLAGTALCDLGLKDEGISLLREAISIKSTPALLLGLAAEVNNIEEKEGLAKEVLKENPVDCDALRHLASIKYFNSEIGEATKLVNKIIEIDPSNVYGFRCKGDIYFHEEKYQKALKQYLQVKRRVKPTPVSIQLKICHCYYLLGKIRKAKKLAKKLKGKIASAYAIEWDIERASKLLTEILNS